MSTSGGGVLSMVEKGWGAARRVSIELARQGIGVHHFVRGRLPRELIAVLTPYAGVRITGLPVRWYRPALWAMLLWRKLLGRPALVLVDNERAEAWVRQWRLSPAPVVVVQQDDGRPVLRLAGRDTDLDALQGLVGARA